MVFKAEPPVAVEVDESTQDIPAAEMDPNLVGVAGHRPPSTRKGCGDGVHAPIFEGPHERRPKVGPSVHDQTRAADVGLVGHEALDVIGEVVGRRHIGVVSDAVEPVGCRLVGILFRLLEQRVGDVRGAVPVGRGDVDAQKECVGHIGRGAE